ncbi:MAG TPA: flagellar export chaperone FliS [Spirochaetota bacterium]|nr:MAG: Flagellar protein FliS [Spirochaetes bacterium ADurb.Bin133]HNZ26839.1 flagellar export chaperone FliS [Spirochaetota bacterium]HOF01484.1 flagellar export chaperone FliS [Spirochaetota bacterium]HOS31715.1 flagellar export chaperone FliS [Spirochaetota bacterium]HOS54950.1 flagellar export chaperone FliS [Spirochaetota bacterium]
MIGHNPYQQYKKTQIDSASQSKLIVMLYDGAIKFINLAIEAMATKSIEKVHINIIRAQDIIVELISSLNMEVGEISERLLSIYMYINKKLTEANIKKSKDQLYEVKKYLQDLRDAWDQASKTSNVTNENRGGVNIAT